MRPVREGLGGVDRRVLTGFVVKPWPVFLLLLRYSLQWAMERPIRTTQKWQVEGNDRPFTAQSRAILLSVTRWTQTEHTHHEGQPCTLVKAPQVDPLTR